MYEPCTRTQANEFDPGDSERETEKEKEIEKNRPLGSRLLAQGSWSF